MIQQKQNATRTSWNVATRFHNAHKGDQASFLRLGGDTLFPEELTLLGELKGQKLVHLQCNSGQDSLCLARRGAQVVGVDFSDEAIKFARHLSFQTEILCEFEESEVISWLETTAKRFDLAFASYGVLGWHEDLDAWFRGVHRVLQPGGRLVIVEFHPLVYSIGPDLQLSQDDYFAKTPFIAPVHDYVGESELGLLHGAKKPVETLPPFVNQHVAYSYQYTMGDIITSVSKSGMHILQLVEWPYTNGWRPNAGFISKGRHWVLPESIARVPLMFGLVVQKPL